MQSRALSFSVCVVAIQEHGLGPCSSPAPQAELREGVQLSTSLHVCGLVGSHMWGWPQEGYAGFSHSEGFAQLQAAWFLPGWQVESWAVAQRSTVWRDRWLVLGGQKPENPP